MRSAFSLDLIHSGKKAASGAHGEAVGMSKPASLVGGSMQQVIKDLEYDVEASARLPQSSTSMKLGS